MRIQKQPSKEDLIQRLRRIEGQVRGVQGMLADERDCQEVLQQLAAVRSALQSVSRAFLQQYVASCLLELEETPDCGELEARVRREGIIQDMIAFLDKAP